MEGDKVACPGCGKQINARFAACPFCGAQIRERAQVRATSLDGPSTSGAVTDASMPAQMKVAIATSDLGRRPEEERVTGVVSAIRVAVLPSKHVRGWMRYVEIVLTVLSSPFIFASMAGILFQGVKRWGRIDAFEWLAGVLVGVPVLGLTLYVVFGFSFTTLMSVVGASLGAWIARGVLRWFAKAARLSDYS